MKLIKGDNDYVLVVAPSGDEIRLEFDEKTTLKEFKNDIMKHLFKRSPSEIHANQVPATLRIFWRGVEIREGIMWHHGVIGDEEDELVADLAPPLSHGQPFVHAHLLGDFED